MKTKFKILSAIAVCSLLAGAFAFAACGETPADDNENPGPGPGSGDGTTEITYLNTADDGETSSASTVGKTWTELAALTMNEWDTKTIVFQFVSPLFDIYSSYVIDENSSAVYGDKVNGIQAAVILNLYQDGTAAAFEVIKIDDSSVLSTSTNWYNSGAQIYTALFGWWIGGYDGSGAMGNGYALKVALTGPNAKGEDGKDWVITNENKTPESIDGAYALEINAVKEGDNQQDPDAAYIKDANGNVTFRYEFSSRRYLGILNPIDGSAAWVDDTKFPEGGTMTAVVNDIKYDKAQQGADAILGKEGGGPQGEQGEMIGGPNG